jgi:23S rRNA pseudouridine955/2504/2580 synthase
MPVQGGPHHPPLDALLDAAALRFGRSSAAGARLDRDTSGVLLLARRRAPRRNSPLPRTRAVEKTYWAIVARWPIRPGASTCRSGASAVPAANDTEVAERSDKEAARAITDYRTLDHAGQKLAWLELSPLTGRTHQLRVHCVAIGAPILRDVKYARPDQNNAFAATVEDLSNELHLHARALRLPHPAGGTLVVEADLPPHMTATFRTLGFHAPPAHPPQRR